MEGTFRVAECFIQVPFVPTPTIVLKLEVVIAVCTRLGPLDHNNSMHEVEWMLGVLRDH